MTNLFITSSKGAVLKGSLLIIVLHLNSCATNQTLVQPTEVLCLQLEPLHKYTNSHMIETLCIQINPCAYTTVNIMHHAQGKQLGINKHKSTSHQQDTAQEPFCNQSTPCVTK